MTHIACMSIAYDTQRFAEILQSTFYCGDHQSIFEYDYERITGGVNTFSSKILFKEDHRLV